MNRQHTPKNTPKPHTSAENTPRERLLSSERTSSFPARVLKTCTTFGCAAVLFGGAMLTAPSTSSASTQLPKTVNPNVSQFTVFTETPEEKVARLGTENSEILSRLQSLRSSVPELEKEIQEAESSLRESQSLIPQLEKEVGDAKKAAEEAREVYVVRDNETKNAERDVEQLKEEVEVATSQTEEMQTFVSNVVRDMYIQGGQGEATEELEMILSDEEPARVVARMENAKNFTDKAGEKVNQQIEKKNELNDKLVELEQKQLEVEQNQAAAAAQKELVDQNLAIAVEREQKLNSVVQERQLLLSELNTQLSARELAISDLSSTSASLSQERDSLQLWLQATASSLRASQQSALAKELLTGAQFSAPLITEAAPGMCPKFAPRGTNWNNVDINKVCAKAVAEAPSVEAQKAILYAFNHLGASYSQGNRLSTNPPIFDCSSFVARAYNAGGAVIRKGERVYSWINMFGSTVRYTENVYSGTNLQRVTNLKDLKPGDVFIQFNGKNPSNSGGDAGHAQIYLGVHDGKPLIIQSGGGRDSRVNVSEHYNGLGNEWVFRYTKPSR